jgi:hypothetical protein
VSSTHDHATPETAAGTAAGRTEQPVKPVLSPGAAKRANASVIGMIMALAVTLLALIPIILLSANSQTQVHRPSVDVAAIAADAKGVAGFAPVAPQLPEGYSPNYARWSTGSADGVSHWDVGYVTPKQQFVSIVQTVSANPTWVAQQVKQAPKTGTRNAGEVEWTLYDKPGVEKSYVGSVGGTTVILSGSAAFDEFDAVAAAVAAAAR